MKYIKTLILLALLIPQITFGAVAVGWNATSTASNLFYPNLLNGILKVPSANEFRANFFTGGFFVGTTTATSTFTGGIQTRYLNTTSTTASSTFANGINLTGGCFSINGVCIGTGTGSGSVTSVAMTVPSFLSVSGSPITTSGTLAVTLSGTALPVANGGTASTTNLGGILVGNGSSAIKSLVIGSNLTFDGTTLSATGGGSASSTLLSDMNTFSTTGTTTFNAGIKGGLLNITSTSASSTFANGINLTGGCFSINGSCISGGGGGGSGTVTSVDVSGGTTGLTYSGGPITTSGTITMSGTLGTANGGTASTTSLGGILVGNGASAIKSASIGTGLTFDGTTLSTTGGGSVTGNGIAGMMASWSSASNLIATSTIMAEQVIATSTRPSHFGTSCITTDGGGGNAGSQGLEVCGSDNSITGVNLGITNINPGTSAYGGLYLNNNEADAAVTKYAGVFLNSGNYTDVTLGSGLSTKSQLILQNSMNAMTLAVGTTTATSSYVNFLTGGFALENERMRITGNGNIGIASTAPSGKLAIQGDSDITQLYVRGNGTQTNPVFRVQSSAGSSLLTLANSGSMSVTGAMNASSFTTASMSMASAVFSCVSITSCTFANGGTGTGLSVIVRGGSGTDSSLAITSSNHATPSGDMIRFSSGTLITGAIAGRSIRTWNIGSTTKALGKIAMLTVTATSTSNSDLFAIEGPTTAAAATSTLFEVTADGKVGLASSSPWRTLSVVGTVAFNGLTTSTAGNAVCILANKDVVDAGGTTCTTSSRRFKESIKDLSLKESLDIVLKMQPKSFHRKVASPSQPSGNEIGFIAEEVNDIDSRLVEYETDGVTPRGVNYASYTAHLTGAIQALNEKIDNLNPSEAKKSVQDNYQWIVIGLLVAWNLALTFKRK